MRAVSVLVALSLGVVAVLICQAVQQEFNLRHHRSSLAETSSRIHQKEDTIVQINLKIQEVNNELSPLNEKKDGLLKKKEEFNAAIAEWDKSLQTCIAEKAEAENKKTGATEALQKTKDDQEAEKKKAQEEIQGLKQHILDRDKAVCAFVDLNQEEGRKLCGITEAPN